MPEGRLLSALSAVAGRLSCVAPFPSPSAPTLPLHLLSHSMLGVGSPPVFCVCLVVADLLALSGLKVCVDGAHCAPGLLALLQLLAQLPFCLELWRVHAFILD